MGLPRRDQRLSLISIAMRAPHSVISAMSGKLGMLPGGSTKTVCARTAEN